MIGGIGVDACEIGRIEEQLQKGRFLERYFTAEEAAYVHSKGACAAQSLAALFAAKEAALKALGTGIAGIPLQAIGISHTPSGQPYYVFSGKALEALGSGRMHLSLTHEANLAIAMAVYEKDA